MSLLTDTIAEISSQCTVNAGSSHADCDRIREALGHGLPEELAEFYSNWQSISGEYGTSIIWSADRVIEDNLAFRGNVDFQSLYMPFDCCLFFADAGDGDQFFVPVYRDGSTSWQVYVWNHETDERIWVADHIHQFIKRRISGDISGYGRQQVARVDAASPSPSVLTLCLEMKRFLRSRVFRLLVCFGIFGVLAIGGVVEPRSSIGHVVFHTAYSVPPTRPAYLRFYSWSLKEFEGGYLPPSIDEFLIDRLAFCGGKPEEAAIIDFQIRQGSGRWGESASRAHEICQHQMISNVMARLDGMSDQDAVSAMVFIESLRRRKTLGKGGFAGMWTWSGSASSLNRSAFGAAKQRFRAWWGDGSNWPGIRTNDPLAGTELAIHSGP